MKENKYEELMYLSAIGEICKVPYEMYSENFICFKPNKVLSNANTLCLTRNKDEKDCVIETRLNVFQKKMGLDKVVTGSCGMTRLKSLIMSYMLNNDEICQRIIDNCAKNLDVMQKRRVLTAEQVSAMNEEFVGLVNNFQKSYNQQSGLIL